jgi:hypothetical protein
MKNEFASGLLDSKTIYIIGDVKYWELLKEQLMDVANGYQIDGLNVIIAKP